MHIIGATTVDLSSIGGGCGDVLVGYSFKNFLFELKDPNQAAADRKPRPSQEKFARAWVGQYALVETSEAAMRLMGVNEKVISQMTQARAARRALAARLEEAKSKAHQ